VMPTTGRKLASRAAAILIIIAAAIVLLERAPFLTIWFLDDKDAPDARIVHAAFAKAGTANERELRLDLSAINSGAWQVLCLVGGYEHPASATGTYAEGHGVPIKLLSRVRSWLWVTVVPESGLALAYVSSEGLLRVYRLRLPTGLGYLEHLRSCATRADPVASIKL
jgi:hypothetical protein